MMGVREPAVLQPAVIGKSADVAVGAYEVATVAAAGAATAAGLPLQDELLAGAQALAVPIVAVLGAGAAAVEVVLVAALAVGAHAVEEALLRGRVHPGQLLVQALVVGVQQDVGLGRSLLGRDTNGFAAALAEGCPRGAVGGGRGVFGRWSGRGWLRNLCR